MASRPSSTGVSASSPSAPSSLSSLSREESVRLLVSLGCPSTALQHVTLKTGKSLQTAEDCDDLHALGVRVSEQEAHEILAGLRRYRQSGVPCDVMQEIRRNAMRQQKQERDNEELYQLYMRTRIGDSEAYSLLLSEVNSDDNNGNPLAKGYYAALQYNGVVPNLIEHDEISASHLMSSILSYLQEQIILKNCQYSQLLLGFAYQNGI